MKTRNRKGMAIQIMVLLGALSMVSAAGVIQPTMISSVNHKMTVAGSVSNVQLKASSALSRFSLDTPLLAMANDISSADR